MCLVRTVHVARRNGKIRYGWGSAAEFNTFVLISDCVHDINACEAKIQKVS